MSETPNFSAHISDVLKRGRRTAVREHFGIDAFGVNAFAAEPGEDVVNEHTELGGRQEELYVVTEGHARFVVNGDEIDAPAGTLVFVREPRARRRAVAEEPGTTVLAVGGTPGAAYADVGAVGADFWPLYEAKDYEGAVAVLARAHEEHPDNGLVVYNLACMESLAGRHDDALKHLEAALQQRPEMAQFARDDDDFASLRAAERFQQITAAADARAGGDGPLSDDTHAAAALSEVTSQAGSEGSTWIRIRKHFGVEAFGVNAYSAREAGGRVIEDHTETGSGAARHQELYYVVRGRARFTVAGEELDAPAGTLVFVGDPETRRGAVAEEPDTMVLAVGGTPGQPYELSPWDYMGDAFPKFGEEDYAGAKAILEDGLRRFPDNPSALYNLACCESLLGERDAAVEHLARSVERDPRLRELARDDADFEPIREDPRFAAAVAS